MSGKLGKKAMIQALPQRREVLDNQEGPSSWGSVGGEISEYSLCISYHYRFPCGVYKAITTKQ